MPTLEVKGLPSTDSGRLLVRLNEEHRNGVKRYGIMHLTNVKNGQSLPVLVLGHDDATSIYMPYDIRAALGHKRGEKLDFRVRKTWLVGKLRWLLFSPDPAVFLPAWIAIVSLLLTALGLLGSLCSLAE